MKRKSRGAKSGLPEGNPQLIRPRCGPGRVAWRLGATLLGGALLAANGGAHAQTPAAADAAREPGSELTVYLMTIGPGAAVWEKFGHNAIWISDASTGSDLAYNYGMFSFAEPGYLRRFLAGDMQYWMEPFSGPGSARAYAQANRSVWVQELNLSPAQRVRLRDFLEWNARPENRVYRYDYYRDNCSTRVRDAIDRAIGGALRAATEATPTGTTYRSHSLRLTATEPLTYTGLLLGLGPMVDHPISAWEESFIPMRLREHVRAVTVPGPDGTPAPLVLSERTLFESTGEPPPDTAPDRTAAYLLFGAGLGALFVLLGRAGRTSTIAATAFLALAIAWSATVGLFGVILAALWAFTDHAAAYANENLFQVNPLPLALAVALPLARRRPGAARAAVALATAIAAIAVLGFVLQLLPALDQVNGGIIALVLPVHLALAVVLRWSHLSPERDIQVRPEVRTARSTRPAATRGPIQSSG